MYHELPDAYEAFSEATFENYGPLDVFRARRHADLEINIPGDDAWTRSARAAGTWVTKGLTPVDDAQKEEHGGQRVPKLVSGYEGPENPVDEDGSRGADEKYEAFAEGEFRV